MRGFIPDWWLYLAIVVAILYYANRGQPNIAPAPPLPELGPLLPSESPRDDRILVDIEAPRSGVGTAFAITSDGDWVTARHVVDSCEVVGIKVTARQLLRIDQVDILPDADLARLSSRWTRLPLPTDLNSPRVIGETGFFFGYPQGKPGEVVGSLISRGRMQVRGRYQSDEGVLVWSELSRSRGLIGSLGGLSGGPVLDRDGELIGVVAAETPRRGRIYTVSPGNLRRVVTPTESDATDLDLKNFAFQADRLRRDRRIAQVVCLTN